MPGFARDVGSGEKMAIVNGRINVSTGCISNVSQSGRCSHIQAAVLKFAFVTRGQMFRTIHKVNIPNSLKRWDHWIIQFQCTFNFFEIGSQTCQPFGFQMR
jgi:hypothetical protein